MTEEEKKAIENANKLINFDTLLKGWQCDGYGDTFSKEQMKAILKLIDKQQKEIEQLANGIRVLGTNPDITTEEIIKEFTEKPITEEYMKEFKSRYISKDKVLKAIGYEENDEEYDRLKQDDEKLLAILDTLYSEVCRLEDIEDKKVEVAVDFIEEKRDKYWEDKIREIIGWNLVIKDEKSNNYRPIKNTSAQDVYEAFYKIRKLLKKPHNVSKDKIREYVNSPEFLDWHLGFTLLDELEYRKNNINELLEEK